MTNPPKKKGTAHETAIVSYAVEHGFPNAHRNALTGNKDTGDVNLRGRYPVALEAKNLKTMTLTKSMREAKAEAAHLGDNALPVVIQKKVGTANVGEYFAVLEFADFLYLLKAAGY